MGESLKQFLARRPQQMIRADIKKKINNESDFFRLWKKMDSFASDISFIRSRYFSHAGISERYHEYVFIVKKFFKTGFRDSNEKLFIENNGNLRRRKRTALADFFAKRMLQHHVAMTRAVPWIFLFAVLFIASSSAGYVSTGLFTHYGEFFLPDYIQEDLSKGILWTNMLSTDPVSGGAGIIVNNILVMTKSFVSGIIFGIPSVMIALFNGWHFGSIMAATAKFSMHLNLVQFVLNHGILEISILIFSAALGMKAGLSYFFAPKGVKLQYFAEEFWNGINSMIIFFIWLFVCGIVESQISPGMAKRLAHAKAVTGSLIRGMLLFSVYFLIHHGIYMYKQAGKPGHEK